MTDPFEHVDQQQIDDDDEFEVDLDGVGGSDFRVPEGDHLVACQRVEKGVSSAGNPMWTWEFLVIEHNKTLKSFTALTPAAMWKVKETLSALGLFDEGQGNAKFRRQDVIGRTCIATVYDDEYNGTKRSTISQLSRVTGDMPTKHDFGSDDVPF